MRAPSRIGPSSWVACPPRTRTYDQALSQNACPPSGRTCRPAAAACVLLSALSALSALPASAADVPATVRLSTGVITRELAVRDGRLVTVRFVNEKTGRELPVGGAEGDFALTLMGGHRAEASGLRVTAHRSETRNGAKVERFTLAAKDNAAWVVHVEYSAGPGDHFVRKRLVAELPLIDAVDRADVERLPVTGGVTAGGFGRPVFVDDAWFAGLEFPAGDSDLWGGVLTCSHHPGRGAFESPWAVIGAAVSGGVSDEFQRYLDTVRRPPRPCLQYNPWFDLRGRDLNPESLRRTFEAFDEKLLTPHGLAFDAFVIDDGWQDPQSCWRPGPQWPEGFAGFAETLGRKGSRLGLWLPLNGYHLDTGWGRGRGWEQSDARKGYFCLAGEKWNAAVREAVAERLREGNLAYLKHDFNYLRCTAEGHGHPATDRHGLEANTAALIGLLQFERSVRPDLVLNLTTGTWPSPWWLMHADFVWMGGHDYNRDPSVPRRGSRSAEMTFRDAGLARLLRSEGAEFPPSALMTHGIIRGRHEGIDPAETAEDWADYLAMFFGRGTLLHELYVSPDLMPEGHWPVLGRWLRWARANADTLAHTRMIGGRPDRGQMYGYVHWSADKGVACLRNPSPRPGGFLLTVAERPGHLPDRPAWHAVQIHPHRRRLGELSAAAPLRVEAPSDGVVVIELLPQWPTAWGAVPVGGRFDVVRRDGKPVLVLFDEPGVEVRPVGSAEAGMKEWRGRFAVTAPSGSAATLEVTRFPAGGAWVGVSIGGRGSAASARRGGPGWDAAAFAVEPTGEAGLYVSLPASPFWPQRASVSAVLRVRSAAAEARAVPLPADAAVPEWPPSDTGVLHERTLLDDHALTRTRGAAESLGWLLLLGVLPGLGLPAAGWWIAARRAPRWSAAGAAAGLLLFVLVCRLTPLGEAVGRVLGE